MHAPIWTGGIGLGIVTFMPTVMVAIVEPFDYRNWIFERSFLAYANWVTAIEQTLTPGRLKLITADSFMGYIG